MNGAINRDGSYRNGTSPGKEAIQITITLSASELAYLDTISPKLTEDTNNPEHSRSIGVQRALLAYQRANADLLALHYQRSDAMKADPSLVVTDEELEAQIAAKIGAQAVHVEN